MSPAFETSSSDMNSSGAMNLEFLLGWSVVSLFNVSENEDPKSYTKGLPDSVIKILF